MGWVHDQDQPVMADQFEIYARFVGLDGWKVTIRKKHIGQPWERVDVERYSELDADELLQVLESTLGRWLSA